MGASGAVSIIDMGSAEGTFVNGKRVSKGPLQVGDEVKLGGLRIVRLAPEEAPGRYAEGAPMAARGQGSAALLLAPETSQGLETEPVAEPAPGPETPVAPAPAAEVRRSPRPALALVGAPEPRPVVEEEAAGELGVELRVLWGETLLDARTFVTPGEPVTVGDGARCSFRLSGPDLPGGAFPILRYTDGEYRFLFARAMKGGVREREGAPLRSIAELVEARRASPDDSVEEAYAVPVPPLGLVRGELGSGLAMEARFRQPPKAAVVPWWERLDYRYLNLLLVLLFLFGGFVVAVKTTTREVDLVQDDLAKGQQRMAKFVMKAPEERPRKNPYLEKLKRDLKKEAPGEMAERHKGEEGQMGKRDAPKTNGRSAPRAIDPNAKELVKSSGLLAALGKGKGPGGLSTVFGQGGLGGDLKGAIGNMFGPVVGDSHGVGGLGLKGNGPGGGGQGETIGIGAVGTKGRGGGLGGYGSGVGGLGSKRDREVAISTGETRVLGAIDPELIRKVIRDHADQVRYCYEQQLTLNPRLGGKVAIRWQINAGGNATDTVMDRAASTGEAGLDRVAECIMSRIVTWEFPKPKGGGVAIVTYPWILRSSGSMAAGG